MTREITKAVTVCDFCDAETYPSNNCLGCQKHICFDCQKTRAIEYRHAVHCSGSGDGMYCLDCHRALLANPNAIFLAYLQIADLRIEGERFYRDYERRTNEAEAGLKKLQEVPR